MDLKETSGGRVRRMIEGDGGMDLKETSGGRVRRMIEGDGGIDLGETSRGCGKSHVFILFFIAPCRQSPIYPYPTSDQFYQVITAHL